MSTHRTSARRLRYGRQRSQTHAGWRDRLDYKLAGRALSVGVDIGGTHVKAGVVDHTGHVVERLTEPTPTRSPQATEEAICRIVSVLTSRHDVRSLGVGAAGFVDEHRATVLFSPHLAWRREPLRDRLQERLGLRVVVENDANAAAWAETQFGAAQGEDSVVLVTLGTGIGGGIVTHGQLERGRFGMAGEFGHMVLVPQGTRCECGNRGCWEQYAGGSALIREGRELAASASPRAQALVDAVGGDLNAITGQVIASCAQDGDPACTDLLRETGNWLGIGLANLAAALDPGVIVVGGGVAAAGRLLLGPAQDAFNHTLTGRGFRPSPRIVAARLGNDAGFIGAADLSRYQRARFPRREARLLTTRQRRSS
ncbi:ROK family glucokinase [Devriesea agamarum]|uniref:ROK family glucokinase n=1 Tax=Devriesea agamarum TaxID=472569 RepID=UPI000829DEF4|nr:ROK family glucokinase [Devriesea agamarum]